MRQPHWDLNWSFWQAPWYFILCRKLQCVFRVILHDLAISRNLLYETRTIKVVLRLALKPFQWRTYAWGYSTFEVCCCTGRVEMGQPAAPALVTRWCGQWHTWCTLPVWSSSLSCHVLHVTQQSVMPQDIPIWVTVVLSAHCRLTLVARSKHAADAQLTWLHVEYMSRCQSQSSCSAFLYMTGFWIMTNLHVKLNSRHCSKQPVKRQCCVSRTSYTTSFLSWSQVWTSVE